MTALDLSVGPPAGDPDDFDVWSPGNPAGPDLDRSVTTPEDHKDEIHAPSGPTFALARQALRVLSTAAPPTESKASEGPASGGGRSSRGVNAQVVQAMRYLHDADVASIVPPNENRMRESEVWSCGQNSYGELAHGDTKSRTVLTQVSVMCDGASGTTLILTADNPPAPDIIT